MSRNTTARRSDWKSTLGLRRRKQYDIIADLKDKSVDDILNINFDNISGSIMETGDAFIELNAEQKMALKCLLEKRRNKKMNIADVTSYDINDCHRKLDKYREEKKIFNEEAKRIADMAMDEAGIDKFKKMNMPYTPIRKITTNTTATARKGGRRTRTRRKTRKSHKRHKKRSTKRRR